MRFFMEVSSHWMTRPTASILLSLLFHGIIILIFLGYLTTPLSKTGVLPQAIAIQIGHYQLEQQSDPEINSAPKQVVAQTETPTPRREVLDMPKVASAEKGAFAQVSDKKTPQIKQPKANKVDLNQFPKDISHAPITSVPISGKAVQTQASFSSHAPQAVSGLQTWHSDVLQKLAKAKRYPREALRYRAEGISQIKITVNEMGEVIEAVLLSSSGTRILDKEALATIRRASPFSAPPEHLLNNQRRHEFIAPITFNTLNL